LATATEPADSSFAVLLLLQPLSTTTLSESSPNVSNPNEKLRVQNIHFIKFSFGIAELKIRPTPVQACA
jgi:hypothetical protein